MTEGAYHIAFLSEDGAPGVIFYSQSLADRLGIPSPSGDPVKVDWWSVEWKVLVVNEQPQKLLVDLTFGQGSQVVALPRVEVDLKNQEQVAFVRRIIERRILAFVIAGSRGDLPMTTEMLVPLRPCLV